MTSHDGEIRVGEIKAWLLAKQVQSRIAAFGELASVVRRQDTGQVLATMEHYAASNPPAPDGVDLAIRAVPR